MLFRASLTGWLTHTHTHTHTHINTRFVMFSLQSLKSDEEAGSPKESVQPDFQSKGIFHSLLLESFFFFDRRKEKEE